MFGEDYPQQEIDIKLKLAKDAGKTPGYYLKVVGVPFSTMGKEMLSHAKYLMDSNYVLIHRKFDKLLIGLRTAVADDYDLKKGETSYNDIVDSFRLSLLYYQRRQAKE